MPTNNIQQNSKILTEPYIVFQLGETTYSINCKFVQQLEMIEHITPVPNAPDFVDGVVMSRGQVIPVINLRVRFGLPKSQITLKSRLIVVKYQERTAGLLVDSCKEFINIPEDTVKPPPQLVSSVDNGFISGVTMLGEKPVFILDVAKTISELNNTNM
jgi:purine-binding chemotaxis protein CheW